MVFMSALGTLDYFVKDKERIPTGTEYWVLVGTSLLITLVVDTVVTLGWMLWSDGRISGGAEWLIVYGIGLVVGLVVLAIAYSKFFARRALDRARKAAA